MHQVLHIFGGLIHQGGKKNIWRFSKIEKSVLKAGKFKDQK